MFLPFLEPRGYWVSMPDTLWTLSITEWRRSVGSPAEHSPTPSEEVGYGAEKMGLARLSQT